ncbi:MAG: hypothetical protein ACRBBN_18740 [Methyloligellaceae bacterium]
MKQIWKPAILRLSIVAAYAATLYIIAFGLNQVSERAGVIATLTFIPLFYGSAIQIILDPDNKQSFTYVLSRGLIVLTCIFTALVLIEMETWICIAMAIVPFFALMVLGLFLMRHLLQYLKSRRSQTQLNLSLWFLPLFLTPLMDTISFPKLDNIVTTEITINAPPALVWKETMEIPEIRSHERIWTFTHNIMLSPQPIDAVLNGNIRQLRWTNGVRFQEHITKKINNRFVAWDFVFNEPETLELIDPHIKPQGGLLNLKNGSYSLTPLDGKRTRLILKTHYSLQTPVNFYLELWGRVLLQDFHTSVLTVIKKRAEQKNADMS